MTREEFMDIVYSELHSDGDNYRANRIIDAADDYAEEQSRWIPVSERLPEEDGKYICTIDVYDRDRIVDFVTYNQNLGWYVHNVTAWMPLPPSYQGE